MCGRYPASPTFAGLDVDALPTHVLYQEIVATSQTYMRQCVAVEPDWILPMLRKVQEMDVDRLMGRAVELPTSRQQRHQAQRLTGGASKSSAAAPRRNDAAAVAAARARYLARRK